MTPEAQPPKGESGVPEAEPAAVAGASDKAGATPRVKGLSPAALAAAKRIVRKPSWARPYASGRTRGLWLQTFLALAAAAWLGLIVSDLLMAGLARDIASGNQLTEERVNLPLLVGRLAAILAMATMLTSFVLLLVWVHRAYRNLHALGARYLGDSPALAVGSFFIPLAHLVMPVLIVGTIWRGSEPQQDPVPKGVGGRRPGVPLLVAVWWLLWVGSGAARVGMGMQNRAESGEALLRATQYALAVHGLSVIAFILTFVVVKIIQNMQDRKWASLSAAAAAPAAPTASGDSLDIPTALRHE